MELRDVEALEHRISVNFDVCEGRGVNMQLGRAETILLLKLLDNEIHERRQKELPEVKKMGMSYEEFMEYRKGKK